MRSEIPSLLVFMGLKSFQQLDLSERAQRRLNLALEEADRLQRLLNEILLYARSQRLQPMELELNTLIRDILDSICVPVATGRFIRFIAAPVPVRVSGDPDKLKQVLINLITNACEAVPPGDAITCQVAKVADKATLQIHNSGEPIPADLLPSLTKPFSTTKSSGNGLGLAIVQRIVEAHGGTLMIESSVSGTTVSFQLLALGEAQIAKGSESELAR